MEPRSSLPCSQQRAIKTYHEPDESSMHCHTHFFKILSGFLTKIYKYTLLFLFFLNIRLCSLKEQTKYHKCLNCSRDTKFTISVPVQLQFRLLFKLRHLTGKFTTV